MRRRTADGGLHRTAAAAATALRIQRSDAAGRSQRARDLEQVGGAAVLCPALIVWAKKYGKILNI